MQIFRRPMAHMKINQIRYVIFQPKSQFSSEFCITLQCHNIISMKFSNWNIICFGLKEPIKVQFFRLLSALITFPSIPHAIFETPRSEFIQILYHYLVSWKITPFYFCSSSLVCILWTKKSPSKRNFQTFGWLGSNPPNSSCIFETTSQFFFKLCIIF